ncbi:uncharacterized protein LOC106092684 [Stomoxys calcitrans]|uniref:uncharacterized protein LOC106092684 n=1 Tax=Stomoxys calcitrans TaxID=35570 RepID=UPI0027E2C77D|nr:uncharacterized protein LOC106092684 [Stomoxys calcitrans]
MHRPSFGYFEYCNVSRNAQNDPSASFYIKILQLPVTSFSVHIEVHYLSNVRQPIVPLNSTWDYCQFLANRKRFRSFERVYNLLGYYTNVNHSCPYNHDIIGKDMSIDTQKVPFPLLPGVYALKTLYYVDGEKTLSIDASGKVV